MAKQKGPVYFTGCSGGITFYKMNGVYYQRRKSSLSRKRVKRDPAFARTMRNAGRLGQASQLAARIYRTLPRKERQHALYRRLTGDAMIMLKQGKEEVWIQEQLQQKYLTVKVEKQATQPAHTAVPVKRARIASRKPTIAPRLKEGRLWITADVGLHQLSVHAGDLHHQVLAIRGGRCLVPG